MGWIKLQSSRAPNHNCSMLTTVISSRVRVDSSQVMTLVSMRELERERIGWMKYEIIRGHRSGPSLKGMLNCESVEHSNKSFTKIERKVILERIWFTDPVLEPRFGSL